LAITVHRLSRARVRTQTVERLRLASLKRPGISNHARRRTAETLGYPRTGNLRAVQEFPGHADPRTPTAWTGALA
jgi:hypothetical protein